MARLLTEHFDMCELNSFQNEGLHHLLMCYVIVIVDGKDTDG